MVVFIFCTIWCPAFFISHALWSCSHVYFTVFKNHIPYIDVLFHLTIFPLSGVLSFCNLFSTTNAVLRTSVIYFFCFYVYLLEPSSWSGWLSYFRKVVFQLAVNEIGFFCKSFACAINMQLKKPYFSQGTNEKIIFQFSWHGTSWFWRDKCGIKWCIFWR